MDKHQRRAQVATIAAVILGFLVFPLAGGARAGVPPSQIDFTPHVTPPAITQAVFPTPIGPVTERPEVVGGFMWWGETMAFPIGCEFLGGEAIPVGATTESATGIFGYATIEGAPEYVLIWFNDPNTWYTPGPPTRRTIIIRADDPLFAGTPNVSDGNGFEDYVARARRTEDAMGLGAGGIAGGVISAWLGQVAACPGTGGITCATAWLTGLAGVIGGGVGIALNYPRWLRDMGNVAAQFHTIALECGSV